MSLGATIAKIRKMKKIKIRHICGDMIDPGNYWRFEKGQISVSADTFYQILNNLNISYEEFHYLHNESEQDFYTIWGRELIRYYGTKDLDGLKEVSSKALNEYQLTNQIKYHHLHLLTEIYLAAVTQKKITKRLILPIKNYLIQCEEWGYYEVSLFSNTLFAFGDLSTILTLYKKAYRTFSKTQKLHKTTHEETLLSVNVICLCLEHQALTEAKEINQMIQSQKTDERAMFSRTVLLWCDGLVDKLVNRNEQGLDKIESSFTIMETLSMTHMLKMFKDWTQRLL
ncbi:Rgg family transcriptional regulator [Amphibacillus sediminis]|uniref:Rgg family transcriptional regulator n=1 Tax=Amphibacillus sediminis TaxID=360185 RepID=UPI00082B518C|nr:helix-turn-helix domain-containing protein [Amphibacillus sediminis]